MACSSRPVRPGPAPALDADPAARLAEILRLIADIAEPSAVVPDDDTATDLPIGLRDVLSAWESRQRAVH